MEKRALNPDWQVENANELIVDFEKKMHWRPARTVKLEGVFHKGKQVYFYCGHWKKPVQRKIIPGTGEPMWRKILRKSLFGSRGWQGFKLFGIWGK